MSGRSDESTNHSLQKRIEVDVNGKAIQTDVEPRIKLSDFLRQEGYKSVRVGCEHGACGACTVLVDGKLNKSCLSYAVQADGSEIETAEGLASGDELDPVQESFHEEGALQCGFCTSGFLMATKALLEEEKDPDDEDIERALTGNLCRCTGYEPIYRAVHSAAEKTN